MPWATAHTVTLDGASGHVVDVQADVSQGLIATTLVGRPDASVNEARERCRTAVTNSSLTWPTTRRVTIALSPAELPKRGSHFDLAVALAVLGADNEAVKRDTLADLVVLGELTLDGRLRAVRGVLPMVMAARDRGYSRILVPDVHVSEAEMVPGMRVWGARSLAQAVALLGGDPLPDAPPVEPLDTGAVLRWRGDGRVDDLDLVDVHGMRDARLALEVVAAGGHHLLLSGPKGAGKTTLAERLPGILPDLGIEEALELSAVHSLAGEPVLPIADGVRPPFRAPHHSSTKASVLGGGTGRVHPGELSKALHGALFLDEFPLFGTDIIDSLRQPLEHGEVTIARGDEVATFPARSIVVLACNPCPCGEFSADARLSRCTCAEVKRRNYRDRMSGPVTDRIDIVRHIVAVKPWEATDPLSCPESSTAVRERVTAARLRQQERYSGTPWRVNADVPGPELAAAWPLTDSARGLLERQLYDGRLTRRGATRVHRLAWTVSDLWGLERPGVAATELALRLRTGDPLTDEQVQRVAG